MKVLVTGVTGYLGAVLVPGLQRAGHEVHGFARNPTRSALEIPIERGDVFTGAGLERALDGVDVAYYLIHSMEPTLDGLFPDLERIGAERFADAAAKLGVRRIVYLGGLVHPDGPRSDHLASRMSVERVLLERVPDSVALRASIVIGAQSRSFRFLVRLIERLPVLAVPAWNSNRTQPIDERDIVAMLVAAADTEAAAGRRLDVGGPDIVTYGELISRIADLMLVDRPTLRLRRLEVTPIASRVASVIASERHELVGPLMESLGTDLLVGDDQAASLFGVRLHSLDAAIERALRVWEESEPLAAR